MAQITVKEIGYGAAESGVTVGMTLRQALKALRETAAAGDDYRAVGGYILLSDGSELHPGNASPKGDPSVSILGRYDARRVDRSGNTVATYAL